jgi:AhpD family alkylhydroperoxidase
MDPRRDERASGAAARAMRCSYCMLAHGSLLAGAHMSAGDVQAIAEGDVRDLDPLDIAVMELAARCFFAKVLDGVGALTDARFAGMESGLRDAAGGGAADRGGRRRICRRLADPRSARLRGIARHLVRRHHRGRTWRVVAQPAAILQRRGRRVSSLLTRARNA